MRLKNFNYSNKGYYFVTISTNNRENFFGIIDDYNLILNQYGKIVDYYWNEIPKYYKNVSLDEYIIMPNHIHGIIIIEDCIDEQCSSSTNKEINYGQLSKVIKSFKEAVTKIIRKDFNDFKFSWMKSYYDHIIRNAVSLNNIRNYIKYNFLKQYDSDKIINGN